jgi:ribosomal protein S14
MKSLKQNDKFKRKKLFLYEINKFILKSITKNKKTLFSIKYNVFLFLDKLSKYSLKNKFNNYCIYTFRKRSLLSKFRMSRLIFLNLARNGQISGIKKSVW